MYHRIGFERQRLQQGHERLGASGAQQVLHFTFPKFKIIEVVYNRGIHQVGNINARQECGKAGTYPTCRQLVPVSKRWQPVQVFNEK